MPFVYFAGVKKITAHLGCNPNTLCAIRNDPLNSMTHTGQSTDHAAGFSVDK